MYSANHVLGRSGSSSISVAKTHLLARVGKASYSLYLFHPIALSEALVGVRYLGLLWFVELCALLAAALLVTRVFFHYVETPFFAKKHAPTVFPDAGSSMACAR